MADGHQQPPGHENAERYVLQTHCVMAMVFMPGRWFLSGGSPREGVRSEARAEQRLAAGGAQRSPNPYAEAPNCANLGKFETTRLTTTCVRGRSPVRDLPHTEPEQGNLVAVRERSGANSCCFGKSLP